MNEREKALDKILREYGCCDIEFRESLLEAIMVLFRNEEKKGGEQGPLHRMVGASVGADEVEPSWTATADAQGACPEPSGSPPLGPQARSGEALTIQDWEWIGHHINMWTTDNQFGLRTDEYKAEQIRKRVAALGFTVSRTDDGERSEHRGPNTQLSELAGNEQD